AFFSARMAELSADGRYIDELERVLYNAMLTAVGESGTEYTYENPLESTDHRRWAWHDCPCCPPMFLKLTGAMPGYIYSSSADTAFVNLFISSKAQLPLACGKIAIETETGYPERGDVAVRIGTAGRFALKLRIPGWALGRENPFGLYVSEAPGPVEIKVNGEPFAFETADGYAAIVREWNEGDEVALSLPVGERTVRANPLVKDVAGKTARARGPVVYALENGACVPYYSVANGDGGAKCSFSVWNSAPVEVEAKGGGKEFLVFSANGVKEKFAISAPVFTLDGRRVSMEADLAASGEPVRLANGVDEYAYEGKVKALDGAGIRVVVRVAPDSPVVRFRYELTADDGKSFTMDKADGRDGIEYFSADVSRWNAAKEMRLSEYDAATHAYRLTEHPIFPRDYENSIAFQGPMCVFGGEDGTSMLLAYEHGSQAPCKFLEFAVSPDRRASLRAVRGNYWDGREITPSSPYETIWFQAAVVKGGEDALAKSYRDFVLDRFTLNYGSRMPYIFYNTWASQERDKWWDHSGDFMNLMNEERILGDIDIAHELGVDVFVVDVSWFRQTGDWIVDENRFPHGLEAVSEKLKRYGMKMGLWFNPTEAAQNSEMMARNRKSVMSYDGVESPVHSVWQTPGSQNICVVSDYWKDFADRLIEIARKLDVTYFKWDGISQFGCNSPDHLHGDARTTGEDRHECYSFEQVRYLDKIVDRICDAIPGAIVDFDVTEGGRCVGLAFLASGKYFATNNGPYYNNLDIPFDWDNATTWCNVYVYPGPARAWVVRSSLDYDKWLPSVLFYAHYLPDGPVDSALINLGSMILGQNGVWGNLRAVSPGNLRIFGEALAEYKKVRDDITRASPVRIGRIGASPEIHEKIAGNGNGAVVIFANEGGEHVYVTEHKAAPVLWKSDTVDVSYDARGRAIVKLKLEYSWGAGIVIFGRDAGDFEVEKGGSKLKVEKARVSEQPINRRWPGHQRQLSQTGFSRFVRFDADGPAELEILAMRDFNDVVVKPLSKKTKVGRCGRRISLEIPGPGAYSVELDGCKDNLMVFADPPAEYGVDPGDPSVRYFGPGEHDAGVIEMKSGETVFIDDGAVVYGRIYAKDADDIRIVGRGILDASRVREKKIRDDPAKDREEFEKGFAVCNVERFDTITLDFCDRVEIDGITIRDSLIYNIRPTGCRGVRINDVKTIGNWRYNSDGFDMHNCRDVVISGSFLRTYDDSICVKGFDYRMDEADMLHDGEMFDIFENVLVTNCTIWCDWGRALEIGAETRANEIRNVRFADCDIIRSAHVALDVQNVDYADVHDVEFENIRVEIDGHTPRPAMQASDDQVYFDDPLDGYMPTLFCSTVLYIPEYSKGDARRGNNRNIRLKDIFVTAPSMPASVLSGFDAGHRTGAVSIDGLYLNGVRVGRDGANVSVGDFADEPDFVE
ncbi:MAG: glycoside hydrolase family 127 protein, partial [Kiritimatiellae bacterium]|nr:glycoside hydrolase family 127 protein [Kiritimatiellia bacterium]